MRLSVIIVSYNVKYFLEKCILSAQKAMERIEGEIIVIDNASGDGSPEMISKRFPGVILIANSGNTGFAKACNQGLSISKGDYALLLNPDTLLSEHTLDACIAFMDSHPDASACGVQMVDGTGKFLPESMRGLPSPASAFFKMTGINKWFPKSMFFNGYYYGFPDPNVIHKVPVLTGAFMFLRMSVLRKVGMLDEDYFMYGEDIDICYRMIKAGYCNYYLPAPPIIHYKGESTQRGSLRYIRHFYNAMMIYVSKHIHGAGGGFFKMLIMLAVVLRGFLAGFRRVLKRIFPVLMDAAIILLVILGVKSLWAKMYFEDALHFNKDFYRVNVPLYCIVWLLFLFLSGAHDLQRNFRRILYGMGLGTIVILVIYAVLPLEYRSSRAVIFLSAAGATAIMIAFHALVKAILEKWQSSRRLAIVGSEAEVNRIMELMNRMGIQRTFTGWISVSPQDNGPSCIGPLSQLDEIVRQMHIGELIFATRDLSFGEINTWMTRLGPSIIYRISSTGSEHIVGSDSSKEQGTLYSADMGFALAYPNLRRGKRLFDILCASVFLIIWPFTALFSKRSGKKLQAILQVLKGRKTFIGYHTSDQRIGELPRLSPGILSVTTNRVIPYDQAEVHMINYIYAREYTMWRDMDLVLKNLSELL